MKTLIIIKSAVAVAFVALSHVPAHAQYYSRFQQSQMFTVGKHKNPTVRSRKHQKKAVRRIENKLKVQETLIVTGAGNPDLAKKKLGLYRTGEEITGNNYTRARKTPVQKSPRTQIPRSAYRLNRYQNRRQN